MATERISRAAVRFEGKVYGGYKHIKIKHDIANELDRYPYGAEDGFLTSAGRFVTREEAATIAFQAGQTPNHTGQLTTESLNR